VPAICFNYYRDGTLVNIKFRGPRKAFKMAKDAELIFYNLDSIKDESEVVIVEGEIDCLTMHESGVFNSVSVPNGASKGNQRLEYLDNCWQDFEGKEKIILCTDNDEPGIALREELARRLGKDRCWLVTFPEGCKDANEVLIKLGKEKVKELISEAYPYPLEGIFEAFDLAGEIEGYYLNGFPTGYDTSDPELNDHLTFAAKQLTMVTGIPGSGKDEYVNKIAVDLAKRHGLKFGMAGFEEPSAITETKIIEKFTGKSFAYRHNPADRLNYDQLKEAMLFSQEHFYFINTDEVDITIDGILEKFSQLVKRYGINFIIISPWNCFEHKRPHGMSETEYVGVSLQKILRFLKLHNLHCFLIAHPTKIQKDKNTKKYEIPTLYSISGSANFFNMTHNGICIYRDFEKNLTDVYIQKVKFYWLGKLGFFTYNFNTSTRQYESVNKPTFSNLPPPLRKLEPEEMEGELF
jgi:twinkle protein